MLARWIDRSRPQCMWPHNFQYRRRPRSVSSFESNKEVKNWTRLHWRPSLSSSQVKCSCSKAPTRKFLDSHSSSTLREMTKDGLCSSEFHRKLINCIFIIRYKRDDIVTERLGERELLRIHEIVRFQAICKYIYDGFINYFFYERDLLT